MLDPKVGRKPEAYASQLGCKLDLSPVEQGRVQGGDSKGSVGCAQWQQWGKHTKWTLKDQRF